MFGPMHTTNGGSHPPVATSMQYLAMICTMLGLEYVTNSIGPSDRSASHTDVVASIREMVEGVT